MKLFKRQKKEITVKDVKKNTAQDQGLSLTNKVYIKIYRSIGNNDLGLSSEFIATEKEDRHKSMYAIEPTRDFKEDLDFNRDRIYDWITTQDAIQGKKRPEKIKNIQNMIKQQTELINRIEKDVKLNAKYNIHSQKAKLNQLKIMLDFFSKHSNSGTYMVREGSGIRTVSFYYMDGLLYPLWWGIPSCRVDPNLTVAKKKYIQEQNIFNNENADKIRTAVSWITWILLIVGLVLTIGGTYIMYHYTSDISTMAKDVNQGTITCTNTLATCTQRYEEIQYKYGLGMNTTEKNINDEKQSINNNPINNLVNIGGKK